MIALIVPTLPRISEHDCCCCCTVECNLYTLGAYDNNYQVMINNSIYRQSLLLLEPLPKDLKYRVQKLIEDGNAKPFNTNFCNLICISVR